MQALSELARRKDDKTLVLAGRCYEHKAVPFKALDGLIDSLGRVLRRIARDRRAVAARCRFLSRLFPVLLQVPAIKRAPQRPHRRRFAVQKAAYSAPRELPIARRGRWCCTSTTWWGDEDGISLLLEVVRPPQPPLLLVSYRSDETASSAALPAPLARAAQRGSAASRFMIPVSELSSGGLRR